MRLVGDGRSDVPVTTDMSNLAVGLAAVEVQIASQAAAFIEAGLRESERISRLNEKMRDLFSSMEARQAALALQMLEANVREDERLKSLEKRLDERHSNLVEKMDERHEGRSQFEETMLDTLKEIRDCFKPLDQRVAELEHAKSKVTAVAVSLSGAAVFLGGAFSWLIEHVGKWVAPVFLLALMGMSCGCGGDDHPLGGGVIKVYVAANDLPCVQQMWFGIEFWQEHGVALELTPSPDNTLHNQPGIHILQGEHVDSGTVGRQFWSKPGVCINLIKNCHKQVVAHEIGHCLLGPGHHSWPRNLMHPHTNGSNFQLTDRQLSRLP
jgi:hypothetical protein